MRVIHFMRSIKFLSIKPVFVILTSAGFVFALLCSLFLWDVHREGPLISESSFEIPHGTGVSRIGQNLTEVGAIRFYISFRLWAKITGEDTSLHAGKYLIEPKSSLKEIVSKLHEGQTQKFKVTFPEGLRTHEILEKIKNTKSLVWDLDNVAGYSEQVPLLPETYVYDYGMKASNLLDKMHQAALKELEIAWDIRIENLPIASKQELLTLASIVEKETAVDAERKEVAGVFVHRLKKGMKLQSDPTVIYGIKNYDGNIRRRDLNNPHPYNTYRHKGLPPGPIAHPGKASLRAVAQPHDTENLYFVADGTGGHVFAKNLTQHNKNVKAYLDYYRKHIKNKK